MGCGCQDKKRMKEAIEKMRAEAIAKREAEIKAGTVIQKQQ